MVSHSLDGKRVNVATLVVSLVIRLVMLSLGLAIIAFSTPATLGQVFGVGLGALLILGARNATITFSG